MEFDYSGVADLRVSKITENGFQGGQIVLSRLDISIPGMTLPIIGAGVRAVYLVSAAP